MNNDFFQELETGDLILFSDVSFVPSRFIEYMSGSKYSHIGMILKDPLFLVDHDDEEVKNKFRGIYLLESTGFSDIDDIEDGKKKLGVQIRDFEKVYQEYNGAIFWRKLNCDKNDEFFTNIKKAHDISYNKTYDLNAGDWIKALYDWEIGDTQRTDEFVCSSLCAFIYTTCKLIDESTHWTVARPKDFGTEFKENDKDQPRIKFTNCSVEPEVTIKKYELIVHNIYSTF